MHRKLKFLLLKAILQQIILKIPHQRNTQKGRGRGWDELGEKKLDHFDKNLNSISHLCTHMRELSHAKHYRYIKHRNKSIKICELIGLYISNYCRAFRYYGIEIYYLAPLSIYILAFINTHTRISNGLENFRIIFLWLHCKKKTA